MENNKPKNIIEYRKWLHKHLKIDISSRNESHYYVSANKIKQELENSKFWIDLTTHLKEIEGEFLIQTGCNLLISDSIPKLLIKPFSSFLLKIYRKNVLENEGWPNEPKDGWVLPTNWFSQIDDIVRTSFVVKYLDGVEFLIMKIQSSCSIEGLSNEVSYEAREDGYYAAHLSIRKEFEIPKINFDTEKIIASIEIQVTTQLQELIKILLHKYYEDRRDKERIMDVKWQWNYKSPEFATNYLGHILHYIEGMIVDIREKQKGQKI